MKWICSNCKGTNIEIRAWTDANTKEFIGYTEFAYLYNDDNWCRDCEAHTEFELVVDEDKSQLKLEL